jgi:hypothetical protein
MGDLLITALYEGFVPISADEFHGAPRAQVRCPSPRHSSPAEGGRGRDPDRCTGCRSATHQSRHRPLSRVLSAQNVRGAGTRQLADQEK